MTTFGPAELTPGKVAEVVSLDPEIIIDNWHSSQGEPLKEGREYVALINFPGAFNTSDLLDVLRHNGELLNIFD